MTAILLTGHGGLEYRTDVALPGADRGEVIEVAAAAIDNHGRLSVVGADSTDATEVTGSVTHGPP
ncbi:hypothetical protein ACNJ7E_22435 [Rhodococcus sp. NM-2]|uniref:hypothetical protein n=1 Tax=Rhodococcus sp. NM-2 TaxID=3401174 RepID=UPI003AAE336C